MTTPLEPRFTDLLELSDATAVERHFDSKNHSWLRIYALAFAAIAIAFGLYALARSEYLSLLLPATNLVLIRWLFIAEDKTYFRKRIRHFLTAYLLVQLGFLVAYYPVRSQAFEVVGLVAAVILIPFRFELLRSLALYIGLLAAFLAPSAIAALQGEETIFRPSIATLVLSYVLCAVANIGISRREFSRFSREFRVESSRYRQSKRMREELDYARQIQLQMLPQGDPKLPHLDICGICLPATEVGGDYYEYFRYPDPEIAIAIGDVAGHGVASGLLLSGIRSCLHLLQPEALDPSRILQKLNRMVRDTNKSRMFISLLYLVLNYEERTLALSCAGHPPLLHFSRSKDRVTELGHGAPPLGTRLEASFIETRVSFERDDVFLLLTDGLHETRDQQDEIYGLDRLARRLRQCAQKQSREIREAILGDVWNFKGNAEQEDDVTLVVIKAS